MSINATVSFLEPVDGGKPRLRRNEKIEGVPHTEDNGSNRDVVRGVWELARLHTREAWLCWYPAGECFCSLFNLKVIADTICLQSGVPV